MPARPAVQAHYETILLPAHIHNPPPCRRPAFLLDLICKGWPPGPALQAALAGNPYMVRAVQLWHSTQPLLQYAAVIARCAMVPPNDKERLSNR